MSLDPNASDSFDDDDDGKFLDIVNPLELDQLDQLVCSQEAVPAAPRPPSTSVRALADPPSRPACSSSSQSSQTPTALPPPPPSVREMDEPVSASQRTCGAAEIEKKKLEAMIKRKRAEAQRKLRQRREAQAL